MPTWVFIPTATALIRPAINYLSDTGFVSISVGGEYEMNPDSVTLYEGVNEFNLSDRFGDLLWNTSYAMQDAKDAWATALYHGN